MTITAVTPDNVSHEFPDGTDGGVISSAIKTYLSKTATPDSSFGSDLKAGAGGAMSAAGNLSQGLGSVANDVGLPNAVGSALNSTGDWLKSNAPQVPNYHDRGGDIVHDLGQGEFSKAGGDVLHGLVGSVPTLGATALAGAVGGPVGAGAVAGGLGLGTASGQRAAAEGNAAPTTSQVVRSIPRAAADAALGGLGFGGLGTSAAKRLLAAGGASGLQSGVDQVDATGTVDPSQMANSAILGAGTAGALEGVGAVRGTARAGVQAAQQAAMPKPKSDAEAQAQIDAGDYYTRADAEVKAQRSGDTSATAVMNVAKNNAFNQLKGAVTDTVGAGQLDKSLGQRIVNVVRDQALRHNNVLTGSEEGGVPTEWDDLMSHPDVPQELRDAIARPAAALDQLSTQSFKNAQTGPLQQLGQKVGGYIAPAAMLLHGNLPGAALAATFGHGTQARLGAALGAMGDRALGTATPTLPLTMNNASKYLGDRVASDSAPQTLDLYRSGLTPAAPTAPSTPTPGFIRPKVQAPDQSQPSTPTPPFRVVRPAPPQPADNEVGLPNTPVPVNTPIRGGQATLPPLRVDTPADVNHAVASDPTMAAAQTGAVQQQARFQSPGTAYIGNMVPGATHDSVLQAVREMEGQHPAVPVGSADMVAGPAPLTNRPLAQAVQAKMNGQLRAVGIDPETGGTKGVVRNPLSYAANLRQEQNAYDNVPQVDKQVADFVRAAKTRTGRAERLTQAQAADPGAAARLQQNIGSLTQYGLKDNS